MTAAPAVLLAGLCTVDLIQRVDELPAAGEKVQSRAVSLVAGGPAANAAVAVAAVGGRPTLVTALGGHPLAALARAELEAFGVVVVDVLPERAEPPTVSAAVVRERDGERTVVSHNAAGMPVDVTFGDAYWAQAVASVGAVLVDGHHPALALAVVRAARGTGVPVVLDAGSWKPVLENLLPLVDVCACAASFRLPGHPGAEATERALHDLGVPVVTRTGGPRPVRWSHALRAECGEVAVPAVAARDTLGAGDVWHGVLAYGVACLGRVPAAAELPSLIRSANDVAALRVRHAGPRAWIGPMRGRAE
ncbi:PfkB family carbohydrate kinase [Gandjariella thermophila]|uniref:Ribokinase n=1 Tax=Gandjariella thermophila TaxID=1931992 RepID=A0A4D4JFS7_9PSEU|nr:PfkB family carbohydrate kinase [Gandjariella thermophila]GDY33256.1 ribokinase [Gandjariella thermophila]